MTFDPGSCDVTAGCYVIIKYIAVYRSHLGSGPSNSITLSRAENEKKKKEKNCERQQCSACAHAPFSLRVPTETCVPVEYCVCAPQAMHKVGSNLHPAPAAYAWDHLTLITPNRDDCDVARSR